MKDRQGQTKDKESKDRALSWGEVLGVSFNIEDRAIRQKGVNSAGSELERGWQWRRSDKRGKANQHTCQSRSDRGVPEKKKSETRLETKHSSWEPWAGAASDVVQQADPPHPCTPLPARYLSR